MSDTHNEETPRAFDYLSGNLSSSPAELPPDLSKFQAVDILPRDTSGKPITTPDLDDPRIYQAIIDKLPTQKETDYLYRMMSRNELHEIIKNRRIGGTTVHGQVRPGETWWGPNLQRALDQRNEGKIRENNTGASWGGNEGVVVAVRIDRLPKSIQDTVNKGKEQKLPPDILTKEPLTPNVINAVFYCGRGKVGQVGIWQLHFKE